MAEIRPQIGAQEQFLSTDADICLYGGSAFCGKSFALLLEPLRHVKVPGFTCVVFRRTYTEITAPGGLWSESLGLYGAAGGKPFVGLLEWRFPSNAVIRFAHLQYEADRLAWNGAQICLIEFDQLESFTRDQFLFLFKTNRSACGVRPYIRATLNPSHDSFVRELLDWWIDKESGLPIAERSGVIRYFKVENDEFIWSDDARPGYQSFTFIAATRYDNKIGLELNPDYESRLEALPLVDRLSQRDGNWNQPPVTGSYFQRRWFKVIEAAPIDLTQIVRYWDRAATEPNPQNTDPDWTVGCKVGRDVKGNTYIMDAVRARLSPGGVETTIVNTASQDGPEVMIGLEQEPGASGKADVQALVRALNGYNVRACRKATSKEVAAKPLSAQAEAGNVYVVRGPWNDVFFKTLEAFPNGKHDDDVDAVSGGYNILFENKVRWLPPRKEREQAAIDAAVQRALIAGQEPHKVLPFMPMIRRARR